MTWEWTCLLIKIDMVVTSFFNMCEFLSVSVQEYDAMSSSVPKGLLQAYILF